MPGEVKRTGSCGEPEFDSGITLSFANCDAPEFRQYIVTPSLATTSTVGSAQDPPVLPRGGTNIASLSTVTASKWITGQEPFAAIDGNVGGYPGNDSAEWNTDLATPGITFTMKWNQIYNVTSIVLYDRPNLYGQWSWRAQSSWFDRSRDGYRLDPRRYLALLRRIANNLRIALQRWQRNLNQSAIACPHIEHCLND